MDNVALRAGNSARRTGAGTSAFALVGASLISMILIGKSFATAPPLVDATQTSAGGFHTCAIVDGGALCWGFNKYGQLGNGAFLDSATPTPVIGLSSGVTAISAGGDHTCAIVNGTVKCWGRNPDGELGNGTLADSAVPVTVAGITGAIAIAAGGYHSCALLSDHSVRCWGLNNSGQLGDGTIQSTDTGEPTTPLNLGNGVSALAVGEQHSCALAAGTVKCWGYNHDGELSDGSTTDRHAPVDALGLSTSVSFLSAGAFHSCAIDGTAVRCWGFNSDGQLGNGTTMSTNAGAPVTVSGIDSPTSLDAGGYHTCALVDGGAKCWGDNTYGQLGNGSLSDSPLPVSVTAPSTGVTRLTAGGAHSCAEIDLGGQHQMRCWGDNIDGELGLGDQILRSSPVLVVGLAGPATALAAGPMAFHSCALVDGGAWCWGNNAYGELGDGTNTDRSTAAVVTGLNAGVSNIASGGYHTCAVVNGAAMCWGLNSNGQIGNGNYTNAATPVVVVPSGVSAISAGAYHTCAIVNSGVQCWGRNANGELADGSTDDSNQPVVVQGLAAPAIAISAGGAHTCVALSTGKIQCWGYNSDGQLGDGTTNSTYANPPVTVANINGGATALAAGGYHTCAIVDGGAQCWGNGEDGALGDGQVVDSGVPVQVVGFTGGVDSIVAGGSYSCLIASGAGYCWGNALSLGGTSGQVLSIPVSLPPLAANVVAIGTGYEHGCAIISGAVACVGFDHFGQLGDDRDVFLETPGVVVEADEIFHDGFDGE